MLSSIQPCSCDWYGTGEAPQYGLSTAHFLYYTGQTRRYIADRATHGLTSTLSRPAHHTLTLTFLHPTVTLSRVPHAPLLGCSPSTLPAALPRCIATEIAPSR